MQSLIMNDSPVNIIQGGKKSKEKKVPLYIKWP